MSFDLFKREEKIIAEGRALLGTNALPNDMQEHYEKLLRAYEKQFKATKRLVRLSDRNEAELNKMAHEMDQKNQMLEGLSKKLSKYLSPQIYRSIFEGDRDVSLETKRKKLTVFFSDIKDFTSTTESLQAEDLTYLLNKYFSEMSKIALEYGATIDKFIGDAIVIFFGDPESQGIKQDAQACVRMSIAMQRRMKGLQEIWRDKGYEKPFQMRIGINTGFCNVGNFGSDERMDYTIIGGEVNLAARLESKAEPGGILMSYETYALVREIVAAEEMEATHVKGIQRDVRPYRVVGIYDDMEPDRFIHSEKDGMLLMLDREKLNTDQNRKAAIAELESAIKALKS